MKNIYRYVFLVLIISVIIGCSAAPPSVKEEPAQSEAVTAPAPVVEPVKEPEPKETMPSVKQEPAKPTVPVKPAEPKQEAPPVAEGDATGFHQGRHLIDVQRVTLIALEVKQFKQHFLFRRFWVVDEIVDVQIVCFHSEKILS